MHLFVQSLGSKDDGEQEECCGAVWGILLWFQQESWPLWGGQSWPATAAILSIQKPAEWTAGVPPFAPVEAPLRVRGHPEYHGRCQPADLCNAL